MISVEVIRLFLSNLLWEKHTFTGIHPEQWRYIGDSDCFVNFNTEENLIPPRVLRTILSKIGSTQETFEAFLAKQ